MSLLGHLMDGWRPEGAATRVASAFFERLMGGGFEIGRIGSPANRCSGSAICEPTRTGGSTRRGTEPDPGATVHSM